jgi:competence protein ComEC
MLIHKSQIFSGLLALFLFSIALFTLHPTLYIPSFTLLIILGIGIVLCWKIKMVRYILLIIFVVLLAMLRVQMVTPQDSPKWINHYIGRGVNITGRIIEVPKSSGKSQQIKLKIEGINGNIQIICGQFPEYQFGDTLQVEGKLTDLSSESEQYRGFFKSQEIYGFMNFPKIYVLDAKYPYSRDWYFRLRKPLLGVRIKYENIFARILPEPQSGLMSGILLGSKANLTSELISWLQITGTIHIIALSGYNITVLVEMMRLLAKRLSQNMAFLAPIFGILFFILATGLSASVIRAGIMGSILLFAKRVGRQSDGLIAVLFASCAMVLLTPNILIYDVGFQLSFTAVCGIIFLAPQIEKYFMVFGKTMSQILAATFAAQIFSWPITSYYFGIVSLVAPIANMLILPFVPLLMLLGFIIASIGFVSIWLSQSISIVLWAMLSYFIKVVQTFAQMPLSSQYLKIDSWIFILAYYIFLVEIVMILSRMKKLYAKE